MKVYQSDTCVRIKDYYGVTLFEYRNGLTIRERLASLAERLWEAFANNNPVVLNEINNYHPGFIGKSWEEIRKLKFQKTDAYVSIAKQYGYETWAEVPQQVIDVIFEKAVDTLLDGDQPGLNQLIVEDPTIPVRRSRYGHGASLLHYLGSNGFELYRQVVPYNLPVLLEYLILAGSDPHALMNVYGGQFRMIDLFNTSIHPKEAGLSDEFNQVYNRLVPS